MKFNLLFIGNKFSNNSYLKNYILREVEKKIAFIDSITFFQENDNSLFLHLERELSTENKLQINGISTNQKVIKCILWN